MMAFNGHCQGAEHLQLRWCFSPRSWPRREHGAAVRQSNAQLCLGKEAHLSAGMRRSWKQGKEAWKKTKGENGCCGKGRNSRWQWQAWVLGREMRAFLYVANAARVCVQMPELQCFVHVGGLQPGNGGDGLAGAHGLDGCLGEESAHTGPECFSSMWLLPGAVPLEVAPWALHWGCNFVA